MKVVWSLYIAIMFLMCSFGINQASGAVMLVKDGQPLATIVVYMKKDNAQEFFAAQELQSYIKKITGAVIPIELGGSWPENGPVIFIGQYFKTYDEFSSFMDPNLLGEDGFIIKTSGDHIHIGGLSNDATWYGVYEFLYRIGCRFYFPLRDGEYIPQKPTLSVKNMDVVARPKMKFRELWYDGYVVGSMKQEDWTRFYNWHFKVGMGGPNLFINHNMRNLVPHDSFATHPEYFPEIAGERVYEKYQVQLCLSNLEVQKSAAKTAVDYFMRHPLSDSFAIGIEDCKGWCECVPCRKIMRVDESNESPTEVMQYFANQIAEQLDRSHVAPCKLLTYFASYDHSKLFNPPKNQIVHSRCQPVLVNILCPFHSAKETVSNCPNVKIRNKWLQQWTSLSDKVVVYEWFQWDKPKTGVLSPMDKMIGPRIKYYAAHGAMGFTGEICGTSMPTFLSMYISARMMWDPNQNPEIIRNEYFDLYFGPSANSVKAYYNLLNQTAMKSDFHMPDSIKITWPLPYFVWNEVVLEKLNHYLEDAERISRQHQNHSIILRVNREKESFRLLKDMWSLHNYVTEYKLTRNKHLKDDALKLTKEFKAFAASVEQPMVINRWDVLRKLEAIENQLK